LHKTSWMENMFARGKNAAVLPFLKIIQAYHTSTAKIDWAFIDLNII
jgi:hypothetical protein